MERKAGINLLVVLAVASFTVISFIVVSTYVFESSKLIEKETKFKNINFDILTAKLARIRCGYKSMLSELNWTKLFKSNITYNEEFSDALIFVDSLYRDNVKNYPVMINLSGIPRINKTYIDVFLAEGPRLKFCYYHYNGSCDRNPSEIIYVSVNLTPAYVVEDGHALSFDGVDDYVFVKHDIPIDEIGNTLTVVLWIKTNSSEGRQTLVSKFNGRSGWKLSIIDGYFFLEGVIDGSKVISVNSTAFVSDGRWHMLVGVISDTSWKTYVDGILTNSVNTGHPVLSNEENMYIGIDNNLAFPYNGTLDELRIYNISLSENDILECLENNCPNTGLIAYFDFDKELLDRVSYLKGELVINDPSVMANPRKVFHLYEDFNNGYFDNSLFEISASSFWFFGYEVTNGALHLFSKEGVSVAGIILLTKNFEIGSPFIYEARLKMRESGTLYQSGCKTDRYTLGIAVGEKNTGSAIAWGRQGLEGYWLKYTRYKHTTCYEVFNYGSWDGSWTPYHTLAIASNGTNYLLFEDSNLIHDAQAYDTSFTNFSVRLAIAYAKSSGTGEVYADWLRIRKYYDGLYKCAVNLVEHNGKIYLDAIGIKNPGPEDLEDFEVRCLLDKVPEGGFYLYNPDNPETKEIFYYCFEQPNGECNETPSNILWVRVRSKIGTGIGYKFLASYSGNPYDTDPNAKIVRGVKGYKPGREEIGIRSSPSNHATVSSEVFPESYEQIPYKTKVIKYETRKEKLYHDTKVGISLENVQDKPLSSNDVYVYLLDLNNNTIKTYKLSDFIGNITLGPKENKTFYIAIPKGDLEKNGLDEFYLKWGYKIPKCTESNKLILTLNNYGDFFQGNEINIYLKDKEGRVLEIIDGSELCKKYRSNICYNSSIRSGVHTLKIDLDKNYSVAYVEIAVNGVRKEVKVE